MCKMRGNLLTNLLKVLRRRVEMTKRQSRKRGERGRGKEGGREREGGRAGERVRGCPMVHTIVGMPIREVGIPWGAGMGGRGWEKEEKEEKESGKGGGAGGNCHTCVQLTVLFITLLSPTNPDTVRHSQKYSLH